VLPSAPPSAPGGLHLVDGTAPGGSTADGRLAFAGVLGAAGYEYRVGASTVEQPVGNPSDFLPVGLHPGVNTVFVRAYDGSGQFGPAATITFTYAVDHPATGFWLGQDGHDLLGPWSVATGDGSQDVHIALSGLPAALAVASSDVRGLGRGEWMVDGPP